MMQLRTCLLTALSITCAASFAACTASTTDGDGGGDNEGGQGGGNPPPPKAGSLTRNPNYTLVCEEPKGLNTGNTPLSRLTNTEYENTLAALLAPIKVPQKPQLPMEVVTNGFSNNWEGQNPSDPLIEQFELGAQSAAAAVVQNLASLKLQGCGGSGEAAEASCAAAFLDSFGVRAFRRPLQEDEKQRFLAFFTKSKAAFGFNKALELTTTVLLSSPQFLYKLEFGEGDATKGAVKLTGYEMASRLSYLLWDSMPDEALFTAAREGKLETSEGLGEQLDRMIDDPRARQALNEFAGQWLHLGRVSGNASAERKNKTLFPKYTQDTAQALSEGLHEFLADSLLGDGGGIKKLLTSNKAWVNDKTAFIYEVSAPQGATLAPVELDASKRRGLTTQAGLLAGLAHDANQAAVLRGQFVLDLLLCQPPPPPPNNMVPSIPPVDTSVKRTTRQRLVLEHEAQGGSCKSCHEIIDGVGFAFENYDAIGKWQTEEEGLPIDSSAYIKDSFDADGDFANAIEMTEKLSRSEQTYQCFVEQFYRYAMARSTQEVDGCSVASLTDQMVDNEGDFRGLLKALVRTNAFRYRSAFSQ